MVGIAEWQYEGRDVLGHLEFIQRFNKSCAFNIGCTIMFSRTLTLVQMCPWLLSILRLPPFKLSRCPVLKSCFPISFIFQVPCTCFCKALAPASYCNQITQQRFNDRNGDRGLLANFMLHMKGFGTPCGLLFTLFWA